MDLKSGTSWLFGLGKRPAGHTWVFGLGVDAKNGGWKQREEISLAGGRQNGNSGLRLKMEK